LIMTMAVESNDIWQDRDIKFDALPSLLEPRRGEIKIDSINSVEDTKGNNGMRGALIITNLRIIWVSHRRSRTNLSIGLNTVLTMTIRKAKSRLRGTHQALYVMSKFNQSRYEFIFTSLVKNSPRLFTTCQSIFRAYETSKLYRDLKLRGSIVRDGELMVLPNEQVVNQVSGVWNLSYDQGNLGVFVLTNVRLVWHATMANNYNVSIPHIQIASVQTRQSKFGKAIVIETTRRSGGYMLGFKVQEDSEREAVVQELESLHKVYSADPIFGVEFNLEDRPVSLEETRVHRVADDVEIIDDNEPLAYTSYLADGSKTKDREVKFDPHLGLAIEAIGHDDLEIPDLWSVVN